MWFSVSYFRNPWTKKVANDTKLHIAQLEREFSEKSVKKTHKQRYYNDAILCSKNYYKLLF
jgi:hypothetical protein